MKNEYYKSFFIAGFTYNEGPMLFKKLKVGKELILKAEPDNCKDENAVAVYCNEHKIGFVPAEKNYSMSKLLKCGHNPFIAIIQLRNQSEHPERQIRVVVYVKNLEEN